MMTVEKRSSLEWLCLVNQSDGPRKIRFMQKSHYILIGTQYKDGEIESIVLKTVVVDYI